MQTHRHRTDRFDGDQPLLHLRAADARLCLPLDAVVKVLPLMALSPLPTAHPSVRGLINLHGSAVRVIDLCALLGLGAHAAYSIDASIVLCVYEEAVAGLLADEIIGIGTARPAHDAPSPRRLFEEVSYATTISTPGGLALLLRLDQIFGLLPYPAATDAVGAFDSGLPGCEQGNP